MIFKGSVTGVSKGSVGGQLTGGQFFVENRNPYYIKPCQQSHKRIYVSYHHLISEGKFILTRTDLRLFEGLVLYSLARCKRKLLINSRTFIKQRHHHAAMTVTTLEPSLRRLAAIYSWNSGEWEHRNIPNWFLIIEWLQELIKVATSHHTRKMKYEK